MDRRQIDAGAAAHEHALDTGQAGVVEDIGHAAAEQEDVAGPRAAVDMRGLRRDADPVVAAAARQRIRARAAEQDIRAIARGDRHSPGRAAERAQQTDARSDLRHIDVAAVVDEDALDAGQRGVGEGRRGRIADEERIDPRPRPRPTWAWRRY